MEKLHWRTLARGVFLSIKVDDDEEGKIQATDASIKAICVD